MEYNGKNRKEIEKIIEQINDFLHYNSPVDFFEILEYNGRILTICGSADFSYYHNIEIKFTEYYYQRENLKERERIANWAKKRIPLAIACR